MCIIICCLAHIATFLRDPVNRFACFIFGTSFVWLLIIVPLIFVATKERDYFNICWIITGIYCCVLMNGIIGFVCVKSRSRVPPDLDLSGL